MEASHQPQMTLGVIGYGQIQAQSGERLTQALRRAGVDILHRCGGQARCTTCRVTFQAGEPEQMTKAERDKLAEKGLLGQARLSCQILCAPGMVLTPVQTEQNSGLAAGTVPKDEIEPTPEWV